MVGDGGKLPTRQIGARFDSARRKILLNCTTLQCTYLTQVPSSMRVLQFETPVSIRDFRLFTSVTPTTKRKPLYHE